MLFYWSYTASSTYALDLYTENCSDFDLKSSSKRISQAMVCLGGILACMLHCLTISPGVSLMSIAFTQLLLSIIFSEIPHANRIECLKLVEKLNPDLTN